MSALEVRLLRRTLKLISATDRIAVIEQQRQMLDIERLDLLRRIEAEKAAIPALAEKAWDRLARRMLRLRAVDFIREARHLIAPEIPRNTKAASRVLNRLRQMTTQEVSQ